ncbi:MAG: DNA polymerase III subunit delta [Bacilli bacterium]|nr:DNA polymerase III subunit delta [Bacilli bacterium]
MYLFYGLEEYLINEEINKIIHNKKIDNLNISKYDLENDNLKDILDDASTISLFDDSKLIIVNNAYIFTGTTNKKLPEQNTKLLEQYINSNNMNTIIIFTINKEKLDTRKKIVTLIKEKGIIKEFNKIDNLNTFILNQFKPYNINNNDIFTFISRVGSNLNIINQEINKIKIYKDNNLNITKQDIIDLTNKNIDLDIFKLIDNILIKNKEKAIECYQEMIRYGEEPIAIAIMLANQIRIMYQSKMLIKKGYSEKDIASLLEIHEFRVKKGLEKARMYSDQDLLNNLESLADLDYNIKTGKIDKNIGLELFILTI